MTRQFSRLIFVAAVFGVSLGLHACSTTKEISASKNVFAPQACAFTVRFPERADLTPAQQSSAQEYRQFVSAHVRLAALCIPNRDRARSLPTRDALRAHLQNIAQQVAVSAPVITVPVPPAESCGEISGRLGNRLLHSLFCYGATGDLIAETQSEGSDGELESRTFLASIAQRGMDSHK